MDSIQRAAAGRHLLRLMDDVAAAGSLEQIYGSALSCLRETLGVTRSSVLVFDDRDVMRFVAWEGLSDSYRAAVEGHSPWSPDDAQATPILVPDVHADPSMSAFREVFVQENIASLAFIPLRFHGRVLGKFMLYYTEPHAFDDEEVAFARIIAGHVSFALEAQNKRRMAEAAAERLDILASAGAAIATSLEPDDAIIALSRFVVRTMADYCVGYRVGVDGRVLRVGLAHADPQQQHLVEALGRLGALSLEDSHGAGAVLRTGEPVLASEIPDGLLEAAAQSPEHLEVLRKLVPRSSLIVPLMARGRMLGAIALAATDRSGRRYGPADLALAQELATHAALLVDNARLFTEAKSASRDRDEMLAIVSHDLRNPLNTIVTACELLGCVPPTDRRPETLASIRRAANEMQRLLDDLLDVSRIERGRLSVQLAQANVPRLLADLISLHAPVAEDKHIRLRDEQPEGGVAIEADRDRLFQALSNLVGNALKFTPSGGEVTVRVMQGADTVTFSVVDTGPGIPTEELERVFDRFWRGPTGRRDGIGLGLTIAKGIAEAHGGRIEARSEPAKGSTFSLVLPCKRA